MRDEELMFDPNEELFADGPNVFEEDWSEPDMTGLLHHEREMRNAMAYGNYEDDWEATMAEGAMYFMYRLQ